MSCCVVVTDGPERRVESMDLEGIFIEIHDGVVWRETDMELVFVDVE